MHECLLQINSKVDAYTLQFNTLFSVSLTLDHLKTRNIYFDVCS